MTPPPNNDAAPLAGGASVNGPNGSLAPTPPVPEGVPLWAWDKIARADGARWAIAERDAAGEVIGTQYRHAEGKPTAKSGSKRGVIAAWPLEGYAGTSAAQPVFVCEGASDTAALLGLGLDAVGVPMAGHCGHMLAELLADRHVVIVADADEPGQRGAAKIAAALLPRCASVRIIEPPERAKDARDAVIAGANAHAFTEAANAAPLWRPAPTPTDRAAGAGTAPAFAPFPVNVLPEPIRRFVTEAAKAIGCDASYVALPLLSGLASAIGTTHRIALKRGWTEPAIVWTAIVGESGTMKTPAFKLAMKAIRTAQADAFKEHDAARAEWEAQHLRYEAELTGWKRQAAKGHSDAGDPPEKPAAPIARRYIVSDTTTEALAPILLSNPRGVLLARDELAGWLGSFDRYAKVGKAGADSAHWLSMHSGEAMTIDRKTGIPPTIHVPSASVSITGGIQPGILSRAMGQEHHESGMLARLLFAMPPRTVKRWTEADVDTDTEAAVAAVFTRLFGLAMEDDPERGGLAPDQRPRLVRLADDGKAAWVRYYNEHATEQVSLSGDEAAAWSKLEGYAARLALVVHLTRWAAGTTKNPAGASGSPMHRAAQPAAGFGRSVSAEAPPIDADSITAGVVLARWFGDEARRVYAILGESDEGRESRRLVELIQRRGGDVSGRELVQACRAFHTVADAEGALSALVHAGAGSWRTPEQRGRGGPKARRFVLAPVFGVNVYRNATDGAGNANPVDVDGVDAPADAGEGRATL